MSSIKMLSNLQAEFQRSFGQDVRKSPSLENAKMGVFRHHLMSEEVNEYLESAVLQENIVEVADALGDIMYTLLGTINQHGFQDVMDDIVQEIHRSNMSKLHSDGTFKNDANGKTIKPEGWTPPDIRGILKRKYPHLFED